MCGRQRDYSEKSNLETFPRDAKSQFLGCSAPCPISGSVSDGLVVGDERTICWHCSGVGASSDGELVILETRRFFDFPGSRTFCLKGSASVSGSRTCFDRRLPTVYRNFDTPTPVAGNLLSVGFGSLPIFPRLSTLVTFSPCDLHEWSVLVSRRGKIGAV